MDTKSLLTLAEYQFTAFVSTGVKLMKFPCQFFLSWKTSTDNKFISDNHIQYTPEQTNRLHFDQQLKLTVKIANNPETGIYQKKKSIITLHYKTENHPDSREVGNFTIDLGELMNSQSIGKTIEHSMDRDKDAKLLVEINYSKLRDCNIQGYEGDIEPLVRRQKMHRQYSSQKLRKLDDKVTKLSQSSEQIAQVSNYVIQKMNEQFQTKIKQKDKIIRDLQIIEEQYAINQVDMEAKIQDYEGKLLDYEIKFKDMQLKIEDFEDLESELENYKLDNNQLRSELETTKKISALKGNFQYNEEQLEEEKLRKAKLESLESDCADLLESIRERQEHRKILEQKYLSSQQECRALSELLQQKDIQVISLKEELNSLRESQNIPVTPIKTQALTQATNQIGIQHHQQDKKNEYMTPQTKKNEAHEETSKQIRKLSLELEIKNQQINQLLNNLNNMEKHTLQVVSKQKHDQDIIKQLSSDIQKMKEQHTNLMNQIWNKDIIIEQAKSKISKLDKEEHSRHSLAEKLKQLQNYIGSLQEQNKQLSQQNQTLLTKDYHHKTPKTPKTPQHQSPKGPLKSPISPDNDLVKQLSSEKSRVIELKQLVQNLKQENKLIITKTQEEQDENDRLRNSLYQAEMLTQSLKKQIKLDAHGHELIKLQLEKQKAISQNIENHLLNQRMEVDNVKRENEKLKVELERITKELQQMLLHKSRKRQRKERSKTKYQNQIKVLSNEVIRLHQQLFHFRMEQEQKLTHKQEENTKNLKPTKHSPQKQKPPVRRNIFDKDSLELQSALDKVKELQSENKKLNSILNQCQRLEKSKNLLKNICNPEDMGTLLSCFDSRRKVSSSRLIHYLDIKAWTDDKLHYMNAQIQRLKILMGLSGQSRRKLIQYLRPIQDCISQVIERPIHN